jgi:hypothetical protein
LFTALLVVADDDDDPPVHFPSSFLSGVQLSMYPVSNAALFELLRPEPIAQRQHLFRRHFFDIFSLFSTLFVQFHSFHDIANVHVIILCLYAPHRSYFYGIPSGIDGVMVLPIFYLIWILSFYVGEVWLKESAKRVFLCPFSVSNAHLLFDINIRLG